MTAALANCIVHPGELVTKVYHFQIIATDTARGVTGHDCSRREDDDQGRRSRSKRRKGRRLASERACLPSRSVLNGREKPGRYFDSSLCLPLIISLSEQHEGNSIRGRQ